MSSSPQTKATTKVVLVGLSPATAEVFGGVFRSVAIEPVVLSDGAADGVGQQNFRACVLQLGPKSEALIKALRNRSGHIAIIGVCPAGIDMAPYARLALTALLAEPVPPPLVEKIVKSTQLLIAGELRKHVRLPIVLEAEFRPDSGKSFTGLTRDLSYGGLALATSAELSPDHAGHLTLKLPDGPTIKARATVMWRHHPDLLGLKFELEDPQREVIRKWIDGYLDLG